ncbi:hypothetical protein AB0I84_04565 [Streptomyces spectabilis]|uniref:hypothetical protein n=1 Tax=Streptomyces spectabilis TaxID=68270 RepID=UPI0033EAE895
MSKMVPMTADEIGELLGPVAAGWLALGVEVYQGGWYMPNGDDPQQQVKVFHGQVMIGWTQEPEGRPGEREYHSVEFTDREGMMYGPAYSGGMPTNPLATYQEGRRRAGS